MRQSIQSAEIYYFDTRYAHKIHRAVTWFIPSQSPPYFSSSVSTGKSPAARNRKKPEHEKQYFVAMGSSIEI